jgi:hypothetical protein
MGTAGLRDNFSGVLSLTAPTGGVVKGKMYSIGNKQVVAMETASATAAFTASCIGAVWATKAAVALTAGSKYYYDASNHVVTSASTGNTLGDGFILADAASGDAAVLIQMCGVSPALT